MMKKFRNYAFVMGVCAAIVAAIVAIGNAFGFVVNEIAITSVITALIGVLVAMGVIVKDPEDETIEVPSNSEDVIDSSESHDEENSVEGETLNDKNS